MATQDMLTIYYHAQSRESQKNTNLLFTSQEGEMPEYTMSVLKYYATLNNSCYRGDKLKPWPLRKRPPTTFPQWSWNLRDTQPWHCSRLDIPQYTMIVSNTKWSKHTYCRWYKLRPWSLKTTISHRTAAVWRLLAILQLGINHVSEQWYIRVYNDGIKN